VEVVGRELQRGAVPGGVEHPAIGTVEDDLAAEDRADPARVGHGIRGVAGQVPGGEEAGSVVGERAGAEGQRHEVTALP
jgi:hypothetical protein